MENGLEQQVLAKAQKWLDGNYDAETKKQVKYLMDNDMKELVESFYKDLEFGTGGLRGVMGVGTNRMNIYTVGAATQGLSNYLKRNFAGEEIRVVVGHDSRNNSRMFAERVADIFASNGFTVFLFDALRPTPELSFAIRELKCQSGVVITASHNPKEYNGYKAYWSDGSQVTAPHDKNIIDEVEKITEVDQVLTGRNPRNIRALGTDFDELYLNKIYELSLSSESVKRFHDMKIVYSPMHGAGVRLVPESLKRFGFTNVQMVPEQAVIDGNFPTVESPNPEERKTMSMAIDLAKKVKADLVLATDPDSDRIGVALPDENGEYVLLNGNQTLVLLMTYQLTRWAELGRLNGHQYVIKTIVTTEMVDAVADYFKVKCYECLTGFKYIAKIIRGHEGTDMQYIGGGEDTERQKLNKLGGENGIGLADLVENRLVGMKSRGVYETPGGTILYHAHDVLETITLDKETARVKQYLSIKFADIVYNGQWYTPLREALTAFVNETQKTVTGDVKLKLYKGNIINAGVTSPYTLYDEEVATFDAEDVYNQKDAEGFINLFGLPIHVKAKLDQKRGK